MSQAQTYEKNITDVERLKEYQQVARIPALQCFILTLRSDQICDFLPIGLLLEAHYDFLKR